MYPLFFHCHTILYHVNPQDDDEGKEFINKLVSSFLFFPFMMKRSCDWLIFDLLIFYHFSLYI